MDGNTIWVQTLDLNLPFPQIAEQLEKIAGDYFGSGKFDRTGIGTDRDAKESSNTAFSYLKANGKRISGTISTDNKDYIINYQDLQGIGMTGKLALPTLVALCSIALGKPVLSSLVVLGEISISGTMIKVEELANTLQVCLDSCLLYTSPSPRD